jgi:hypothetical protein
MEVASPPKISQIKFPRKFMKQFAGCPKYSKKPSSGNVLQQSGYLALLKNPSLLIKHPLQHILLKEKPSLQGLPFMIKYVVILKRLFGRCNQDIAQLIDQFK